MNNLLQRWLLLAPREQWLTYAGAMALVGMLYMLLLGDPLTQRGAQQQALLRSAEARQQAAQVGLADLQAQLAADPNLPYRTALLAAQAGGEQLIGEIDRDTAGLMPAAKMRGVLEELLRTQANLRLLSLQSFSEPLQLPAGATAAAAGNPATAVEAPLTLYKHGLKLSLEGGYFDLLSYLQAIQASGWRLHWDSLDYQVGKEAGAPATITLVLYTLSREAGWIGV